MFRADIGYQDKIDTIINNDVFEEQLSKFIYAMKKQDGTDYHTSSVKNCAAALWRHLNENFTFLKPVDLLNLS